MHSEEEDTDAGESIGKCTPPEEEQKEMLFLIEFLVDTLLLKPEHMEIEQMDPCLLQGQTCMVLTFLHYPPMNICEKDIDPCRQTGEKLIKYNAGKSLMFALSESQFENPPPINLDVYAYKVLPHGTVPNKLPIGKTKICLNELFKQVFDKVIDKPDKLPLSKSIKDNYQLIGMKNKCPTAEATIYIRLSCLGQNVITEFQRGIDDCEPFMFKSKGSQKVYQCKPKETLDEVAEDLCPPLPGWGTATGRDCEGRAANAPVPKLNMSPDADGMPSTAPLQTGPTFDEEDEYDEFGTEVHGHALTIKIQKSLKRPDKDGTGDHIVFQLPQNQTLCRKGKTANKASVYNVNNPDGTPCEPLQIIQGCDSPDKDIFMLRIGKKGETYAKGKLELELRTPKQKIERPITLPRKYDKTVQTESEEKDKKKKKKGKR